MEIVCYFCTEIIIVMTNKEKLDVIEIVNDNYERYLDIDVVAFSFAVPGAMGTGGQIIIIDGTGKIYTANYCRGERLLDYDSVKKVIPIFEMCDIGIFGSRVENDGWNSIYLGSGNHLFIKTILYDLLKQKTIDANFSDIGELFQHWPGFVMDIIGKDGNDITVNDIWKVCK